MSKEPWTFYEEIDAYLGPFGADGYPIGYGKKYCVLFNTDERLKRDPEARAWVRRTTVLLQTYLRKFIVERYRNGTLAALTEKELREAAFDSHPLAYTKGGLTLVALISPGLVPHISGIPRAEFSGPNRAAAWRQFFTTAGLVVPEAIGDIAAGMAGPAHTGLFTRAADQDFQRLLARQRLADYLDRVQQGIADGLFDRIVWLNKITTKLNETEFPDRALQKYAGDIVRAADARKNKIAGGYRRDIALSPELKGYYDVYDPGWTNW
jgi:hypothetical protein